MYLPATSDLNVCYTNGALVLRQMELLLQKHGGSDWSQKQPISGSITKEEEEAVETLYTLVGMFPNSDKTDNTGELVGESSESKHSTLPEARESPAPALGLFLICY